MTAINFLVSEWETFRWGKVIETSETQNGREKC
jgi:hypothetical protein